MIIELKRRVQGKENGGFTLGELFINNKKMCETLEDEKREVKVYGETRIPASEYEIKLRTEGSKHLANLKKYGSQFHKGMLHLQNVPNFEYILIHEGNTDKDTLGCILVGMKKSLTTGTVSESVVAYKLIYPVIAKALANKEKVTIKITDEDVK